MSALGAFTFVLHSHLPYARLAGRWPHGEEWIHEAASECYVPLLETLYDLVDDHVPFKLTLGLTPVLAEQLADPLVMDHFEQYLDARIRAAENDMRFFDGHPLEPFQSVAAGSTTVTDPLKTASEARTAAEILSEAAGDPEREPAAAEQAKRIGATVFQDVQSDEAHLKALAQWYRDFYIRVKNAFLNRFNRDIVGAFRQLQDQGYLEILTSAATHAYLPLLSRDGTINASVKAGVASYERFFGRRPTGIWLPECAYRPAYYNREKELRPGIESYLSEESIKVFFSEAHAITGGQPVGVAAGDVIGPYGMIKRRYVIPVMYNEPRRDASTYVPYYVNNTSTGEGDEHSGVAVIGRNERTGQQVWSSDWGYPGDFDYREFHKKAGTSGLQYWRVTGAKTDLSHKDLYHPDWAAYKVEQHAEHFAHLVGDLIREFNRNSGGYGLISSNYDTELFGHWWFEGVQWLGKVLRHLATDPDVELTTASQHIQEHPPTEVLNLPESSWGAGGTHFTWNNGETHWMWPPIYEAEARMEAIARRYDSPTEDEVVVLNQLARELLLLVSSDWPFLVTTGQAREYAIQRFSGHLERFNRLADALDQGRPDRALAEELYEIDKLFPNIDYRWFIV